MEINITELKESISEICGCCNRINITFTDKYCEFWINWLDDGCIPNHIGVCILYSTLEKAKFNAIKYILKQVKREIKGDK